ncbi:MAG: class II aldolase/adducin family protein [Holophagales bacterium]|nr:class II aldolase/adducin family protein [Holophagales bacterium]
MDHATVRAALVSCGRRLDALGFAPATDGNISARLGPHALLVTPAGREKGGLSPEELLLVDLEGAVVEGEAAPRRRRRCTSSATGGAGTSGEWFTRIRRSRPPLPRRGFPSTPRSCPRSSSPSARSRSSPTPRPGRRSSPGRSSPSSTTTTPSSSRATAS